MYSVKKTNLMGKNVRKREPFEGDKGVIRSIIVKNLGRRHFCRTATNLRVTREC